MDLFLFMLVSEVMVTFMVVIVMLTIVYLHVNVTQRIDHLSSIIEALADAIDVLARK